MRAAALAALLLLAGCTVTVEREGDPSFIADGNSVERFKPGVTTTTAVAKALGPPDAIERQDEELWFRYRFRDIRRASLLLNAYGLNVFQYQSNEVVSTSLVVVFGPDDKLRFCGVDAGPMVRKLGFVDY